MRNLNNIVLPRIIAVDFDGCLCTQNRPGVGLPDWD